LGKFGNEAARAAAGEKLAQIAKSERPAREDTVKCLGLLGGTPATSYLIDVARHADQENRLRAMRALELHPEASALEFAVAMARDHSQPGAVREEAFGIVEATGGDQAIKALLPFLNDPDRVVAERAIEAALAAGKAAAVGPVLERVPARLFKERDDVRDYLVRDLCKLGAPALGPLRIALESKNPIGRVAAVMAIGQLGGPKEADAIAKLARDNARLGMKGFPPPGTVGAEARAVLEKWKTKR
jgi:hypothetical protein